MFYLLIIIGKYILNISVIAFLWFYRAIWGLFGFFGEFFATFFGRKWFLVTALTIAVWLILIIISLFQEPSMQLFDQFYSCIFLRPAQLLMAFTMTFLETGWVFLADRFNDAVFVFRDCVNFFINLLRVLPGLDNLGFYTRSVEALYELLECIVLIPFNVQSWMLPYGATGTVSFFVRNVLCLTRFLTFLLTTSTDFTIFRNDVTVCSWDPNATSIGRSFGSLGMFEVALPPTIIGEENCTKGVRVDCDYLECMIYSMSNFTEPIQATTGVNLTGIASELVEPVCCFVEHFYKPPAFFILALLPTTDPPFLPISEAPDWLVDNMLSPIADCFIEIFFVLSRGTIDDIWELIFSVIFDFIQIFIDSYDYLIECFGLQGQCLSEFPDNCQLSSATGLAFEGLQTCFREFGDCVIEGDEDADIPPNPVINGVEFGPIFQDLLPGVIAVYDTAACNIFAMQQCLYGPNFTNNFPTTLPYCPGSSSSLSTWPDRVDCLSTCFNNRVPIIRPLSITMRDTVNVIAGLLDRIYGVAETIYGILDEICDIVNSIPMVDGCNVPDFPDPGLMSEDRRGSGKGKGNNDDYDYNHDYNYNSTSRTKNHNNYKRDLTRFDNLKQALDHHHIYEEDNICSNVLYEYANAQEAGDNDLLHALDKDFVKMASYRLCLTLLGTGSKYQEKHPYVINVKRMIDLHTAYEEVLKVVDIKQRERHEGRRNSSSNNDNGPGTDPSSSSFLMSEDRENANNASGLISLRGMDTYMSMKADRYKNPNTWLFEPKYRMGEIEAKIKRNSALAAMDFRPADFMSSVFQKIAGHVMEMDGVKLTSGFLGYIHRVNVYYRKVNYGKNKLVPLESRYDLSKIDIGQVIPEDDPYYRHLLQTASSWMAPYPQANNKWEIEANNLHRQKFLEQMTLDYVSLWKNHWAGVLEDSSYRVEVRKKLRSAGYMVHNNKILGKGRYLAKKSIYDLTQEEVSELLNEPVKEIKKMAKTYSVSRKSMTLSEVKDKQKSIRRFEKRVKHACKNLLKAGSHLASAEIMDFIYKDELYRSNSYVHVYDMLTKRESRGDEVTKFQGTGEDMDDGGSYSILVSPGHINNVTSYLAGYLSYDLGRGFISNEEAAELVRSRDNSSFFLWQILKGEYDPYSRGGTMGPFFTDPNKTWIDFGGMKKAWGKSVKEMKLKILNNMYDGDVPVEALAQFRISTLDSTINSWIITIVDWLINDVFGFIIEFLFSLEYRLRFDIFILDWIDSFDPVDIATEVGLETRSYFADLIECNIPQDFNGTNPYKIGCFPFLPRALFSDWAVGVGEGNPYIPLQLGIWPQELIDRACVNVFNGNNDIFNFGIIDNCRVNDGQPRPLCPVCDFCEANYFTCFERGQNGIVPSFFYVLGIMPVLLQGFYTGVISLIFVQRFYNFFVLWISGMGGGNVIFSLPIYGFMIGTTYALTRFLSVTFSRFPGIGEDELPIGAIYTLTLIALIAFLPVVSTAVPAWIVAFILVGLAITWFINLFIPFNGIRENFRLSIWIGQMFEFLDRAPQPLKPIAWTSAVDASVMYDYSNKAVPYVDTFCFLWTMDKLFLMGFGMFIMLFILQALFQLFWPTWLFGVAFVQSTLELISNLRFWQVKENVSDLLEEMEEVREDLKNLKVASMKYFNIMTTKAQIRVTKEEFRDAMNAPMLVSRREVEDVFRKRLEE